MKKVPLKFMSAPIIVLVRPQLAENIGMVARAMMNCGLAELRLVAPRENHLDEIAIRSSSGAGEILETARVYDKLADALADARHVMATTARIRDMTQIVMTPEIAAIKADEAVNKKEKVAWVFGPERTGLENEDLAFADTIVQIPLNPVHSSLNLSQAVLIMGYSWWRRNVPAHNQLVCGGAKVATSHEVQLFLAHLDQVLDEAGYFAFPEKAKRMARNLHNIFLREQLTSSEIKTLYNVLAVLKKK